ncbi:1-acyl-sn-glycerol-3-phosphate acyltransferase [Pontivivens insulae]|uniref:Phospholipid/glycerol acyltransferase domain-containing protein n=1 Tax=Pontivivens insulae TaxID=1639689 RepID=A0A2R8ADJ3_9RHOB|nr:1-acyl-sn-glycerol-3-phosphate acyltransferase [Pontivivens insulae]RED14204.1 putative hemolysin [Pontivivens insulae]SPF30279.1 hypothetical protein POI8812_02615 [Pontivivens insulae]
MKHELDTLIRERAPWMYGGGPVTNGVRAVLHRVLSYDRALGLGEQLQDLPAPAIMDRIADLIARDVFVEGLDAIPQDGPAMVVCNHPTGIADGIVLWKLLARKRPDLFFFANGDILRLLPQFETMIAPVEWREGLRTHAKNRQTLTYAKQAFAEDRLAVIFPSGRLAKRKGLRLHERPWMPSAAMLARKYDLPVIPLRITARNSALFYLFDKVHPTLRDITLFHEVLNKDRFRFHVKGARQIAGSALPPDGEQATRVLFNAVARLADDSAERAIFTGGSLQAALRKRRPNFG